METVNPLVPAMRGHPEFMDENDGRFLSRTHGGKDLDVGGYGRTKSEAWKVVELMFKSSVALMSRLRNFEWTIVCFQ